MKVHHVLYTHKNYGGAESFIDVIMKFSKHSHTIGFTENTSEEAKSEPGFLKFYFDFKSYIQTLDSSKYNIIHPHFFIPAYFSQEKGLKTICSSHCLLSKEFELGKYDATTREERQELETASNFFKFFEEILYRRIKKLLVHSQYHKIELQSLGCDPKELNCPVDLEQFNPNIDQQKSRKLIDVPDKYTLLFLGRATYLKGLHVLLDSFKRIPKTEDIQLLIIGDFYKNTNGQLSYNHCLRGKFTDKYPKYFDIINDNIIAKGPIDRDSIHLYFSASDAIVCPSLYESAGIVNLEAMACGKPVIASKTSGIPFIVQDGKTGFLFEPGNSGELRKKILKLKKNPHLASFLGKNCRKYVVRHHDGSNIVKELDKLYDLVEENEK